jgi:hypothetical protein
MHQEEEDNTKQYRSQYRSTKMGHDDSSVSFITVDEPSGRQPTTPGKTNVQKWLAGLFVQSVRNGEQLLEDGHLAKAAVMFANATLLTYRSETFADAVQRVYPHYFYRLYKHHMVIMGYGHLFPKSATNASTRAIGAVIRRRSPVGGLFGVRTTVQPPSLPA